MYEIIDIFIDKWLPADENDDVITAVRQNLRADFVCKTDELIAQGISEETAQAQILAEFGAKEGMLRSVITERLKRRYIKFQKRYPVMIRCGIVSLIFAPLLIAFCFSGVDTKISSLVAWVVAVVTIVIYIITVEYVDYRFKQNLAKGDDDK